LFAKNSPVFIWKNKTTQKTKTNTKTKNVILKGKPERESKWLRLEFRSVGMVGKEVGGDQEQGRGEVKH
jgi:hypothetical protein